MFFLSEKFAKHLNEQHNYRQLKTLMCRHRLELQGQTPCQFCSADQHSSHCLPLLNLAVFLIHGYGSRDYGRHGLNQGPLGPFADRRADQGLVYDSNSTTGQQTATIGEGHQRPRQREIPQVDLTGSGTDPPGDPAGLESPGSEARGLPEHHAPGVGVPALPLPRGGLDSPDSASAEQGVAQRPQDAVAETPSGHADDADSSGSIGQAVCSGAHHGTLQGVPGPTSLDGRHGSDHAILEMGSDQAMPGAHTGTGIACREGAADLGQCAADHARSRDYFEIPCPQEAAERRERPGHPLAMDHQPENLSGTLARTQFSVLPLHLASHPNPISAPRPSAATLGQAISEDPDNVKVVRILQNSSGTSCFANTVILCLAWLMLLSDGLHPHLWNGGFQLMRNITMYSYMPLDLLHFAPFRWLLVGVGVLTIEAFSEQQDVREFATDLLNFVRPGFINCEWVNKLLHLQSDGAEQLAGEKGTRFTPITIPFINYRDDSSMLQTLIDAWHDDQGLCRAIAEVGGYQLVLVIDRPIDTPQPDDHPKCAQRIDFPSNSVFFPHFSDIHGTVDMLQYEICGLIYHSGTSFHSGHYRAALRYRNMWFLYDDGKLPDRVTDLSEQILRNVTLLWLIRPDEFTDRSMNTGELSRGSTTRLPGSNDFS